MKNKLVSQKEIKNKNNDKFFFILIYLIFQESKFEKGF